MWAWNWTADRFPRGFEPTRLLINSRNRRGVVLQPAFDIYVYTLIFRSLLLCQVEQGKREGGLYVFAANTQAFLRAVHRLLLLPLRSSHTPEAFLKFYIMYSYFIGRFTSYIKATICLLQFSNNFNLMRFVVLLFCYDAISCRSSNR